MNVEALKNFKVKNNDVETLVGVRANLKLLATNFTDPDIQLELPEWIGEKIEEIDAEIKTLSKEQKKAKLKMLTSRRAALSTPDEKRQKLDAEIEALTKSM
jgi:hypothetical protein